MYPAVHSHASHAQGYQDKKVCLLLVVGVSGASNMISLPSEVALHIVMVPLSLQ